MEPHKMKLSEADKKRLCNKLEVLGRQRLSEHYFHIWDVRDKDGNLGATACIQVHRFAERFEKGADWKSLAWWVHDNLPYNAVFFFNNRAGFNLNWRENPERKIRSYIGSRGKYLTRKGMDNWEGDHNEHYSWMDKELT